jgi:hypothetical protein
MAVRTSAGTTLRVTATAPATFNSSGYGTLFTASPVPALVGEVTDMGEFGREYALVTHQPIGDRGTVKLKGSFNEGTMTMTLGLDTDDAGQILAKAAMLATGNYSFRQTMPNGDIYYSRGLVTNFSSTPGDAGAITNASITIERNFSGTLAWVESLAA